MNAATTKIKLIVTLVLLTLGYYSFCPVDAFSINDHLLYNEGSIAKDLLSIRTSNRNYLSYISSDLLGIGIPYNQFTLKLNTRNNPYVLGLSEVKNDVDLPYRERRGYLTATYRLSNRTTLGAKIRLAQIDTVVTGHEYALDVGLAWRLLPKLEFSIGLDNLVANREFSTGTVERAPLKLIGSTRLNMSSDLALVCNLGQNSSLIGLERRLGEQLALFINAANSKLVGGFSLAQKRTDIGYVITVNPLGVQQTIMFAVGF